MSEKLLEGLSHLKVLSDELLTSKKEERFVTEMTLESVVESCTQEVSAQNNEPSVIAAQELIRAEREKIKKAKENSLRELEIIKEKLAEEMAFNDHLRELIKKLESCGYRPWFKMMEENGKFSEDLELLKRDLDKCQHNEISVLETNSQLLTESQEKLAKILEKWICDLQSLIEDLKTKELLLKILLDAEEDQHKMISLDIQNTRNSVKQYEKEASHEFTIHKKALLKTEELKAKAKKLTSAAQNFCN